MTSTNNTNARYDFDFTEFHQKMIAAGYTSPDENFLSWFIGFSEGDGSFVTIKRNEVCTFVVSQSTEDVQILHHIRAQLGFGKCIRQGKRTSRYLVQDKVGLEILISLFNGNLVFPRRKAQFKRWLDWGFPGCKLHSSEILPRIDNGWISGLTDAEGCFTASFLANSNAFRLRFILSQKGDENLGILSHFILLFSGGALEAHSAKENYSYILSGVKKSPNVYNYFLQFPLRTRKARSYALWESLHVDISRQLHLVKEERELLVEKAKEINSVKRKSQ